MNSLEIDAMKLGFNRRNFIEEILNEDFNGSIRECAKTLGVATGYLNDLLRITNKDAGRDTLTKIWRYAIKTGKNPNKYIFVLEK